MLLKSLFALLVLAPLAGCLSVRPVRAPERFIPEEKPGVIWIVTPAEEMFRVARPIVRGDTLVGLALATGEQLSFPLRGVEIRARQVNWLRTGLLAAGIGALGGFVVHMFTRQGTPQTNIYCTIDEARNQVCFP